MHSCADSDIIGETVFIPPANCVCGWLYPPQTVFVGWYTVFTLSVRPSDRVCVRVSVTFCFLNNFKNL